MHRRAVGQPVEARDRQRTPAFERADVARQVGDILDVDQPHVGHVDADQPRQRHHRELVLRHAGEARRGQLDDLRAADALHRNRQAAAGVHDRREFQLHAGQRKAQCPALAPGGPVLVVAAGAIGRPGLAVGGPDGDGAGQIHAQHPQQEELAHRFHAGQPGEIGAHRPLGQQVGEERRQARAGRRDVGDQPAEAILEGEAEHRAAGVLEIGIVEGEEDAIAADPRERADRRAMQQHVEDGDVRHRRPPARRRGCRRVAASV